MSPQKLLRVQGKRSSSGCRSCKARHLKCDEGFPICRRCIKARVHCQYDATRPSQSIQKFVVYSIPRLLPENPDLIYSERRSLHYFRCQAAIQMTAPFHSKLWINSVARLAEKHSFVMSALVALSSMHESYAQERNIESRYRADAIFHYNKAMREITQVAPRQPPLYAVLVSSIIFYTIESLRGCYYRALQHVQSGIKIINDQRHLRPFGSYQPTDLDQSLDRDFLSLQNQIMELASPTGLRAYDVFRGFEPALPDRFESVDDALYYVEVIYNEMHCLIDYYEALYQSDLASADVFPTDVDPRRERIRTRYNEWVDKLASFQKSMDKHGGLKVQQALLLLRIYQVTMKVFLDNVVSGECFERFDPQIAEALDLVEIFIQNENDVAEGNKSRFSLSFGVIPLLFLLATRCNYPATRDKSLALLKLSRRREGVWDSAVAWQLAQRFINFKSDMAAIGSTYHIQISKISFVSENTCEMEMSVIDPVHASEGWFPPEGSIEERKYVEILHLDAQ